MVFELLWMAAGHQTQPLNGAEGRTHRMDGLSACLLRKLCDLHVIWHVCDTAGERVRLNPRIQSEEISLLTDSILIGFFCPILSGINLPQKDT